MLKLTMSIAALAAAKETWSHAEVYFGEVS